MMHTSRFSSQRKHIATFRTRLRDWVRRHPILIRRVGIVSFFGFSLAAGLSVCTWRSVCRD